MVTMDLRWLRSLSLRSLSSLRSSGNCFSGRACPTWSGTVCGYTWVVNHPRRPGHSGCIRASGVPSGVQHAEQPESAGSFCGHPRGAVAPNVPLYGARRRAAISALASSPLSCSRTSVLEHLQSLSCGIVSIVSTVSVDHFFWLHHTNVNGLGTAWWHHHPGHDQLGLPDDTIADQPCRDQDNRVSTSMPYWREAN